MGQVIVMSHGRVVEAGTPQGLLLVPDGMYSRLMANAAVHADEESLALDRAINSRSHFPPSLSRMRSVAW